MRLVWAAAAWIAVAHAAPSAAATLKVSSFPAGAQVWVDGVNTGKVTPMNISLSEDEHVITVQIPGSEWSAVTRRVTIGPGVKNRMTVMTRKAENSCQFILRCCLLR